MSRRTNNYNAFETGTTGPLAIGATAVAVDSAAGLIAPLYLVIDPDDPVKREWIRVNTINSNNLENLVRNLPGSVGDVAHDAGAKIRSVPTKQIFDDLFQDLEDDALDLTQHATDGGDPHSQAGYLKEADTDGLYVKLTGGTMSGALTLFSNPTAALHAATKQSSEGYADGLDHDHATPIAAHSVLVDAHHTKYTDGEAIAAVGPHTVKYTDAEAVIALANNGPILLQVVKWGDSMTITGQGDNNQITYDISSFGFAAVDNLIATVRHGAANQQSRESILTIEGFNTVQLIVNGYGAGSFPSGGAFFVVQIEEYDRDVQVPAPPTI